MTDNTTTSRVQLIRHEIVRRTLDVVRVEDISPSFRRITLSGDSLDTFISASFDDHIKFFFDNGSDEPAKRDYTPRSYSNEKKELVVEFAMHGEGPANAWAENVKVGDIAKIAGPRGSRVIPMDYDWQLMFGDETAFPAISRRLEELPHAARVTVVALASNAQDRREFPTQAKAEIIWVETAEQLVEWAKAHQLAAGEGFVWCAAEASIIKALRAIFVDEKGHDVNAIRTSAYWKMRTAAFHEEVQ
ncbi:siderophore-interacting protein [Rouxiella chamberiensis]|uniref:Siderophore-interacting protein n=1 Tax=Rouxiella chamberiensis TaxID=1513468 RepID=A0ABY7HSN4_9GAMM|nr:siderophore-interacting protein [Rouxiella chamberiensis]WAT02418.1 siderophore-interacting protein [Rouxiella chamberiensis]